MKDSKMIIKLLYLISGIQTKTKCRISVTDIAFIGLSLDDIEKYATFISENDRYYHYCVYYRQIGFNIKRKEVKYGNIKRKNKINN